jgi:hypothetical protein
MLGAGASLAAFPNGDRDGRRLPVLQNLVEVLGLDSILQAHGVPFTRGENFETVYGRLHGGSEHAEALNEIESAVRDYFSRLELPDSPTIYDYLVLSLRKKDLIATFNWDPFLYDALLRNHSVGDMPHAVFLHGAVNVGYCFTDSTKGHIDHGCGVCGKQYTPSRLLYPVEEKNYNADPAIKTEWETLRNYLKRAFVFTVFGYSAPRSDVEAVKLLKTGWGRRENRNLEQIQIVDIKSEDELHETWKDFIHTHHYDTMPDFFASWIGKHPRRTCDAMWAMLMDAKFTDENPAPRGVSLKELQAWYGPLVEVEKAYTKTS